MIAFITKKGRPLSNQYSIDLKKFIEQIPPHIKERIEVRKINAIKSVSEISKCMDKKSYLKAKKNAEKQALMSCVSRSVTSMDEWWNKCRCLGLTQQYFDGVSCEELGVEMSAEQLIEYSAAQKLYETRKQAIHDSCEHAAHCKWRSDLTIRARKAETKRIYEASIANGSASKLSKRGMANFIIRNWKKGDIPSESTVLRYMRQLTESVREI